MRLIRLVRRNATTQERTIINNGGVTLYAQQATPHDVDRPSLEFLLYHTDRSEFDSGPHIYRLQLTPDDIEYLVRTMIHIYRERGITL